MELIWHYEDLDTLANAIATICPTWQVLWMMCMYVIYFSKNRYLCTSIKIDLWPIDKFGEKMRSKQQEIIDKECELADSIYNSGWEGKPHWYKRATKMIILQTQVPRVLKGGNIFELNLNSFTNILLLLGWNAMFLSFTTYLVTQFSLLKHAFRSLCSESMSSVEDEVKCYEKLKEYVDYHNKLLHRVCTAMQSDLVRRMVLDNLRFYRFSDLPNITKAIGFTADYLTELFVFCFAGSAFTKACEVTDAVYDNGWENKSKRFKIATKMIILQSQVPQILTGGGIFEINLIGYTNVVSMAFSVYTLLKSFREEHY
ncbi:Odorant receptor 42b [Carabus blaptoides fortunei]